MGQFEEQLLNLSHNRSPDYNQCQCLWKAELKTKTNPDQCLFFSPWHFFWCPWHFSKKWPWHRKKARDNFGPKKVAVTLKWVPVTKIPKYARDTVFLAVTFLDISKKVPVTLKNVPVTFFAIFFSFYTRNDDLIIAISYFKAVLVWRQCRAHVMRW